MKRLYQLTPKQIDEWRQKRSEIGKLRYGESHLQRYNLVDVMEELLDAINICELGKERTLNLHQRLQFDVIIVGLEDFIISCKQADEELPDSICTDEQGGERIWWNENH
jgi:hypothetical protein